MGVDQSMVLDPRALTNQECHHVEPILQRRFVNERRVTLALREGFWASYGFDVRDVESRRTLFRTGLPVAEVDTKKSPRCFLLLDVYNIPVANMTLQRLPPCCAQYAIGSGMLAASSPLYTFRIVPTSLAAQLTLDFTDAASNHDIRVVVSGEWLARTAAMSVQASPHLPLQIIARLRGPEDNHDGNYRVEIVPGVDATLVVLVAAIMDAHCKTSDSAVEDTATIRAESKRAEKIARAMQRQ